jgi:hypothetical protein
MENHPPSSENGDGEPSGERGYTRCLRKLLENVTRVHRRRSGRSSPLQPMSGSSPLADLQPPAGYFAFDRYRKCSQ